MEATTNETRVLKTISPEQHDALLKCAEALREMLGAIEAGSIDSEECPGDPDSGIMPYRWHQEWAHYAKSALSLLEQSNG